ncbi:MAG: hypothetical protein ACU841_06165 [Gammaproteobacteria bacterium]
MACKTTYGGSRILVESAPPQIQNDNRFKNRWPVSDEEHAALQKEIAGYLNKEFVSFETFRPGDIFQPAYLDIPSKPEADFLWPNIRSFVISERMKRMVFDELSGDVEIVPIKLRKIGSNHPPAFEAGGSEGKAGNSGRTQSTNAISPYYQVLVRAVSDYPKGGSPVSVCSVCKHEAIEDDKRELIMRDEMWRGHQIFFLRTTLYVMVTENLADKIRKAQATNVSFVPS